MHSTHHLSVFRQIIEDQIRLENSRLLSLLVGEDETDAVLLLSFVVGLHEVFDVQLFTGKRFKKKNMFYIGKKKANIIS